MRGSPDPRRLWQAIGEVYRIAWAGTVVRRGSDAGGSGSRDPGVSLQLAEVCTARTGPPCCVLLHLGATNDTYIS